MLKRNVLKRLLGASAVAALFGTLAVQAQTSSTQPSGGQSTAGQSGSSGMSGQSGSSGASGQTGSSGASGQSGSSGMSGQSGSSGASGQSGAMDQSGASGQSGSATGAASGQSSTQGSTAAGTGGNISKADQKHIMNIAMANMAEIEAARMAQTKSQNDQVKTYAQQMIDDHTKALSEVQQLAQSKGVTLPTELDKQHKAKASKLAGLSGEQFDKAYMAQSGVADHKKTHSLLRQAQKAKDPDVKALASRMSPTVDQHLNSAQQMHSGKPDTARGSSGTPAEKSGQ